MIAYLPGLGDHKRGDIGIARDEIEATVKHALDGSATSLVPKPLNQPCLASINIAMTKIAHRVDAICPMQTALMIAVFQLFRNVVPTRQ